MPKSTTKEKIEVVSVSLPKDLLEEVDKIYKEAGYVSRADFVRDAIRQLIVKTKRELLLRRASLEELDAFLENNRKEKV